MDVRVLESGQQRAAAQVHHLGPPADQVADVAVGGADGHDPAASHRDRLRPRADRDDPAPAGSAGSGV